MKTIIAALMLIAGVARAQTFPDDVYVLKAYTKYAWATTNNFNLNGAIERELHDGQWLAGGSKDALYMLRKKSDGNYAKALQIGGAVMSNAEHGNTSYQIKGGLYLGTLGATIQNGVSLAASNLADYTPPPWISKIGNAVSFDFFGGPRPKHDGSVKGNWTYGIGASVNVPIQDTFQWLISGL